MGYFKERDVKRVTLPSDPSYWVDLIVKLAYGEAKIFSGDDGRVAMADDLLIRLIKAWNLDDGRGNVLPITQANIDLIDPDDARAILNEVTDIIVGGELVESADSKKNSTSEPSKP